MNDSSMRGVRCWSATGVAQTVYSDIGALVESADAIFLAAHSPMDLDHRKGAEFVTASSGEARVLEALTSRIGDVERNTLVAVTGGSGSGKSHVVRWVRAHILDDDPRFKLLYVPRAIQTLRDLLRRIIEGLPGVEGAELMQRVDSAISAVKPGEFQDRLIYEMKIALKWTIDDYAPEAGETAAEAASREERNDLLGIRSEKDGRKDGLADLLDRPAFSESLLRPEGRLRKLVESYYDETSRRDDHDEIFTREDLPLRARGVLTDLRGDPGLKELWQIISRNPDDAIRLLDEALRTALPKATGLRGVGGETLDSLFRKSRKALRTQGQELILIFEDLAQFGLVDGELYDQFATPPGEDLAPLRVLFAITDAPYARMPKTVRTRIEHEFHVGGSALNNPTEFVGRYLNLVRVGRDQTQQLWAENAGRDIDESWMLNSCNSREQGLPCRFRDECHVAFGAVTIDGLGDVGLYPYNHIALDRALARLGEAATPREVLDDCLSTVLAEADARIQKGTYPHDRTRQQFDFKVRTAKDALLEQNPSSDPERMYRALVIWGNESALPSGITDAFALDGVSAPSGPPPPPPPPPGPGPEESRLIPLFQWQNGDDLPEEEVKLLREALRDFTLNRLQLDLWRIHVSDGHGAAILNDLFNVTSFDLEETRGRVAGSDAIKFRLTRSAEDMRVLVATRWFRDHGHFDPSQGVWQWPEGYDPGQLMIDLEDRLDSWAAEVRSRFLEITGGSRLACQALGLRAVALAAIGQPLSSVETVSAALAPPSQLPGTASAAWQGVDAIASQIVRNLKASEYVGEFAAVRQGDSGDPQLLDPRELNAAIKQFLANPDSCLREVANSKSDPSLAIQARQLVDALSSATPVEVESALETVEILREILEGQSPTAVGAAAFAVADSAKDAGFFRPSDQWARFRDAIDFVSTTSGFDPLDTNNDMAQVIRGQVPNRENSRLCQALTFIKSAMELTHAECARSGGAAGDFSALQTAVIGQIDELGGLIDSFGREG